MKKRTRRCIFAILGVIVLLAVLFLVYDNWDVHSGSKLKNPDCYRLDFTVMNQRDSHVLKLNEGDILKVEFAITRGSVDLMIQSDSGVLLYQGNKIDAGSFELPVSEAGSYTVYVAAKHASGYIHIDLQ